MIVRLFLRPLLSFLHRHIDVLASVTQVRTSAAPAKQVPRLQPLAEPMVQAHRLHVVCWCGWVLPCGRPQTLEVILLIYLATTLLKKAYKNGLLASLGQVRLMTGKDQRAGVWWVGEAVPLLWGKISHHLDVRVLLLVHNRLPSWWPCASSSSRWYVCLHNTCIMAQPQSAVSSRMVACLPRDRACCPGSTWPSHAHSW